MFRPCALKGGMRTPLLSLIPAFVIVNTEYVRRRIRMNFA